MMRLRRLALMAALPLLAGACVATKQDVEELRTEILTSRQAQERRLDDALSRISAMLDSLGDQNVRLRGDLANRLTAIERQLVEIQELTGQGQQQLGQLRREIARREEEARRQAEAARDSAARGNTGGASDADPQEMYDAGVAALRRGSNTAARQAFEEFLRAAPGHARAADAQFGIGESYAAGRDPARAVQAFDRVLELYPTSSRAPAALLRIGRIEVERGNRAAARTRFNRIVQSYPRSPEATEARRELGRLAS